MAGNSFDQFDAQPNAFDQLDEKPSLARRAGRWLAAKDRESVIPLAHMANLELDAQQTAQMTALLATTAGDERLQAGIAKIMPDAQFEKDQFGNLVVVTPVTGSSQTSKTWTRFYPNPKGLDMTDIMQGAGAATLGELAAFTGGPGLTAAALMGAGEAGMVELASSELSDAQYKYSDIPFGLLGGVVGAKVGDVIAKIAPKIPLIGGMFGRQNIQIYAPDGSFTPEGKALIGELGLDPSEMTREVANYIQASISKRKVPDQAAVLAQAKSLPVPVPLTSGQVTGDAGQQLFEDVASKGGYGEAAQGIMQGQIARQQTALEQNIPAIQQKLGDTVERGAGGAQAQATLKSMQVAAHEAADQLYDAARASGTAGFSTPAAAAALSDALRASVASYAGAARPVTSSILDKADEILAGGGDIVSLFNLRSQLNNIDRPADASAGRAAIEALDDFLDVAVKQELLRGNPEVVKAWSKAIKGWSEYKSTWDTKGILTQLTKTQTRDGAHAVLVVDPSDAANFILGSSSSGLVTKKNLVRDLRILRSTLPVEDFNSIRQEAFMRIMDRAYTNAKEVSGTTLYSYWRNLQRKNPELIRTLFTQDEQGLISQYAAVAMKISGAERNYSNTTAAASGILQRLFAGIGKTQPAQAASQMLILKGLRNAAGTARAAGALAPQPGQMGSYIPGVTQGLTALGATSDVGGTGISDQIERTTGFQVR